MSVTLAKNQPKGFTIVELLIVIVIIGILAAITIVAYNGIQARARDSTRKQDLATIAKAAQLYYADKGVYPGGGAGWCTQLSNPAYPQATNALKEYIATVLQDPTSHGTNTDYFYRNNGDSFILYARMEGSGNGSYTRGGCASIGGVGSYNYEYGK